VSIDRVALLRSAEKLLRQGKLDQAIAEYLRVVEDQPRDWNTANILGDLYLRAGETGKAVEQFTRIADSLSRDGFVSKAAAIYKKILKISPANEHAMLQAAEIAVTQDLLVDARAYFTAVVELRRGRGDGPGVAAIVIRLGALDPADYDARRASARARVAIGDVQSAVTEFKALASDLTMKRLTEQALEVLREASQHAPRDPEIKAALAGLVAAPPKAASVEETLAAAADLAAAASARGDWGAAAAALQDSLARVPGHVPTLLRLVEIGVDGELDAVVVDAQSRLADAYLAAGSAAEARVIAEDLAARHPDDPLHVERLRRALTMLGEADPDPVISRWLAGAERLGEELAGPADPEPAQPIAADEPAGATGPAEISIDIVDTTDPDEPVESPSVRARPPLAEVDLTVVLEDMKGSRVVLPVAPMSLDDVFAQFRSEASQRPSAGTEEGDFARGMALYRTQQLQEAIDPLRAAARAPLHRFEAATALGRILLEQGKPWEAIEWLELAAGAAAPAPEESHKLLYDLAGALEQVGEVARALAICLELRAEAGEYQDVAIRLERLAKVQARG
jgi:tetratricopeptide (TPR) repeat protein